MIEKIAAKFLNYLLQDYIEGLDKHENFKLSILQGNVELENLSIRKEALEKYNLPIVVQDGFLGKLSLKIPWTNISTQPSIINISKVFLLAGPKSMDDYSEEEFSSKANKNKAQLLALHELYLSRKESHDESEKKEKDGSFFLRQATKILNTLQVNVRDIHFRYVDPVNNFCFGITLESMFAQSCDSTFCNPPPQTNSDKLPDKFFKKVALHNLSVYWNSNDPEYPLFKTESFMSRAELDRVMSAGICRSKRNYIPAMHYLLHPVSADANLTVNWSDQIDVDIPRLFIKCFMDKISLSLSELQYKELVNLVNFFSTYARTLYELLKRPNKSAIEDPKAWWDYTYRLVAKNYLKPSWKWETMKQFTLDKKEYIKLFAKKSKSALKAFSKKPESQLTAIEQARLKKLETHHAYDDIVMFRNLAVLYLEKDLAYTAKKKKQLEEDQKARKEQLQKTSSWFQRLVSNNNSTQQSTSNPSSSSAPSSLDLESEASLEFSKDLWRELYNQMDARDLSSPENSNLRPPNYIEHRIEFRLEAGNIELLTAHNEAVTKTLSSFVEHNLPTKKRIIRATFTGFDIYFGHKASGSVLFAGSLNSLQIFDHLNLNSHFPSLATQFFPSDLSDTFFSKKSFLPESMWTGDYLFNFAIEHKPGEQPLADFKVCANLRPLNIVVPKPLLSRIASFFSKPLHSSKNLRDLRVAAYLQMQKFKLSTKRQLEDALKKRQSIMVDLDIAAPNFIIPQNIMEGNSPALVLILGNLSIKSELAPRDALASIKQETIEDLSTIDQSLLYNKYNIELDQLHAFLTTADRCASGTDLQESQNVRLIDKFNVSFVVCTRQFPFSELPSIKADGQLPSLSGSITPQSLTSILLIVDEFVASESAEDDIPLSQLLQNVDAALIQDAKETILRLTSQQQIAPIRPSDETEISIVLNFTIPKVMLTICDEDSSSKEAKEVVSLKLGYATCNLVKSSGDLIIKAKLTSIILFDHIQNYGPQFSHLIKSRNYRDPSALSETVSLSEQDLIDFHYQLVPPSSSLFSYRNYTINRFSINLEEVQINYNKSTIDSLISLIHQSFQNYIKLSPNTEKKRLDRAGSSSSSSSSPESSSSSSSSSNSNSNSNPQLSALSRSILEHRKKHTVVLLEASMAKMIINIPTNGELLIDFHVDKGVINLNLTSDRILRISGGVGQLSVNYFASSSFRNIFKTLSLSDYVIGFEVTHNLDPQDRFGANEKFPGDTLVSLKMQQIQFVWYKKFIDEMISHFARNQIVLDLAQDTALHIQKAAAQTKRRIQFDFDVANPKIIIPDSLSSLDHICGELGNIRVKNDFFSDENAVVVDKIVVNIIDSNLSSFSASGSRSIVDKTTFRISITRLEKDQQGPYAQIIPELSILLSSRTVNLTFTEKQADLLVSIFENNFCYVFQEAKQKRLSVASSSSPEDSSDDHLLVSEQVNLPIPSFSVQEQQLQQKPQVQLQSELQPQSQSQETKVNLKVSVNIQRISFTLSTGEGVFVHRNQSLSSSLINFDTKYFRLDIESNKKEEMRLDLFLSRMTATDKRLVDFQNLPKPEDPCFFPLKCNFPILFSPRNDDCDGDQVDTEQVIVQLLRRPSGNLVSVHIDHPQFIIVPIWFEMVSLLNRFNKKMIKALDTMSKNSELTSKQNVASIDSDHFITSVRKAISLETVSDRQLNQLRINPTTIGVRIVKPEICLLTEWEKPASKALVFKSTLDVMVDVHDSLPVLIDSCKDEQQLLQRLIETEALPCLISNVSVELEVSKVEFYKCLLTSDYSQENKTFLIHPFDLTFKMSTSSESIPQQYDVSRVSAGLGQLSEQELASLKAAFPQQKSLKILTKLEKIDVSVSYRDILMWLEAYNRWLPFISKPPKSQQQRMLSQQMIDEENQLFDEPTELTPSLSDPSESYLSESTKAEDDSTISEQLMANEPGSAKIKKGAMNLLLIDNHINTIKNASKVVTSAASILSIPTSSRMMLVDEKFLLEADGVQINLIDNIHTEEYQRQLMQVEIYSMNASVVNWSSHLTTHAEVKARIDYYNNKLEAWEPVLEPCEFQTNVHLINSTNEKILKVVLAIDQQVYFNLTKSFIETVLLTADSISKETSKSSTSLSPSQSSMDFPQTSSSSSSSSSSSTTDLMESDDAENSFHLLISPDDIAPIVSKPRASVTIRNETGFPLWYTTSRSPELISLPKNAEQPLYAKQKIHKKNSTKLSRRGHLIVSALQVEESSQTITFLMEGNWSHITSNTPINRRGRIPLNFLYDQQNYVGTLEISYQRGIKVLIVRSNIVLINHTNEALDFIAQCNHRPSFNSTSFPKARISLPLQYAAEGTIHFAPSRGNLPFPADPVVISESNTFSHCCKLYTCPPSKSASSSTPFHYLVHTVKANDCSDTYIHIHAPLVFENLLPVQFNVMLFDAMTKKILSCSPSSKQLIHDIDVSKMFGVRGKIQGLDVQREDIKFNANPALQQNQQNQVLEKQIISFLDKQGQTLNLNIELVHIKISGVRKIRIFADLWILNRTNLPLSFRDSTNQKCAGHPPTWSPPSTASSTCPEENASLSHPEYLMYTAVNTSFLRRGAYLSMKLDKSLWSEVINFSSEGSSKNYSLSEEIVPLPQQQARQNPTQQPLTVSRPSSSCYEVAVSIKKGPEMFWRSNIVTIAPRFMIGNFHSDPVFLQQPTSKMKRVLPGTGYRPFHWISDVSPRRIIFSIKQQEKSFDSSPEIDPQFIGTFPLKFRRVDLVDTKPQSVDTVSSVFYPDLQSNISFEDGTIFVRLERRSSNNTFYRINNKTNHPFLIVQEGSDLSKEVVPSLESREYFWDYPQRESKSLRIFIGQISELVPIDAITDAPVRFPKTMFSRMKAFSFSYQVVAEGTVRVVIIEDFSTASNPDLLLTVSSSLSSPLIPAPSLSSSSIVTDVDEMHRQDQHQHQHQHQQQQQQQQQKLLERGEKERGDPISTEINIFLSGIGISIIDDLPQELLFISLKQVNLTLKDQQTKQKMTLSVDRVQIDNQLLRTPFPILLYPLDPLVEERRSQPFFSLQIKRDKSHSPLLFIKRFQLEAREMEIKIEDEILFRIVLFSELITEFLSSWKAKQNTSLKWMQCKGLPEATEAMVDNSYVIYLDHLAIKMLKINFSFRICGYSSTMMNSQALSNDSNNPSSSSSSSSSLSTSSNLSSGGVGGSTSSTAGVFNSWEDQFELMAESTGAADEESSIAEKIQNILSVMRLVANVDGAPLELEAFHQRSQFFSRKELIKQVALFYSKTALRQWHTMLGSSDLLGNPLSLINNIGTGVRGFVTESKQGGVEGVKRGTSSLLKNSLFGISNMATKISSSLGSGAAILTMDGDYIRNRDANRVHEQPKGTGQGLSSGLQQFGKGFFDGITGIVQDPIRGASTDGASGFFKGLIRGAAGVVVKPTVGTIDLVSRTTEGIKNSIALEIMKRERQRAPRHFEMDGILRPFDAARARGQYLLQNIDSVIFANDKLQLCLEIAAISPQEQQPLTLLLLLSDKNLVLTDTEGVAKWFVPLNLLRCLHLSPNDRSILFELKRLFHSKNRYVIDCYSAREVAITICNYLAFLSIQSDSPLSRLR